MTGTCGAARAHDGEVARRISKPFVLLVRGIVLLVDHDEGQPRQRRKHRRAGADDDARMAAVRRAPGIAALAIRQGRVHHRDAAAETAAKALDQLRRQGDFRHQHQRLAAGCDGGGDDPQVHLGFAAAGHAVEQVRAEVGKCSENGCHSLRLRSGEREFAVRLDGNRGVRRSGGRRSGAARHDPAARRQALEQLGREALGDFIGRCLAARRKPSEQGALLRCALGTWPVKFLAPARGEIEVLMS